MCWLSHFAVQQKLTHYKPNVFQKIKKQNSTVTIQSQLKQVYLNIEVQGSKNYGSRVKSSLLPAL